MIKKWGRGASMRAKSGVEKKERDSELPEKWKKEGWKDSYGRMVCEGKDTGV